MYDQWEVELPELTGDEVRNAYIYVPDEAEEDPDLRFPVLYMFDGQNLFFDEDATYGKSWGIREYLEENHIPLIVAAMECSHHDETDPCGGRLSEYSPFDFQFRRGPMITGRGKLTMDYFVNEFKPYIDAHFPTIPDRDHTFISGSSMGGLMTLYAVLEYNDVFSRGAALSPSLLFSPARIREMIRDDVIGPTVLYMDNGSEEMHSLRSKRLYADICGRLIKKGIYLDSRIVPGGSHCEASWERQIPFFIETLFYEL
ncbi:MAG: alpha/beta hydrolase [Lachnospiraceae bacterium]|nr:alpha/beta hydrolase [Lachnospiraceae bacterium]